MAAGHARAETTRTANGGAEHAVTAPNRLAALLLAAVLLFWAAALGIVAYAAMLPPERDGLVVAMFPPGISDEEVLFGVARADGRLVRPTWLSNVWLVAGDGDGFVGRLSDQGVLASFAPAVFEPMTMGGCAFIMPPDLMAAAAP